LKLVGRNFTNEESDFTVAEVLADRRQFEEGDPEAKPPVEGGCQEGTDQWLDTIIGPNDGFTLDIAPPAWVQLTNQGPVNWRFVPSDATEEEEVCRTHGNLGVPANAQVWCWHPGVGRPLFHTACGEDAVLSEYEFPDCFLSGFYPESAAPLEPFGALILGREVGDEFGTSIGTSNALGTASPGDLLISAPGADADPAIITGITGSISDSGTIYIPQNRHLWGRDTRFTDGLLPPYPHQYMIDTTSHCGQNRTKPLIDFNEMVGDAGDSVEIIESRIAASLTWRATSYWAIFAGVSTMPNAWTVSCWSETRSHGWGLV
jgi:hypothetical protein